MITSIDICNIDTFQRDPLNYPSDQHINIRPCAVTRCQPISLSYIYARLADNHDLELYR